MTEAERIWSEKTDDDLLEAAAELDQFTKAGQAVIRAELKRRGLEDPLEQAGSAGGAVELEEAVPEAEEPLECLRCRAQLTFVNRNEESRLRYLPWGSMTLFEPGGPLMVFACPRCGHVELFLNAPLPGAEEDEGSGPPTGSTGRR
jgi:hypothetical protein